MVLHHARCWGEVLLLFLFGPFHSVMFMPYILYLVLVVGIGLVVRYFSCFSFYKIIANVSHFYFLLNFKLFLLGKSLREDDSCMHKTSLNHQCTI